MVNCWALPLLLLGKESVCKKEGRSCCECFDPDSRARLYHISRGHCPDHGAENSGIPLLAARRCKYHFARDVTAEWVRCLIRNHRYGMKAI